MRRKIYIKEWLKLKPYKNHSATDLYYLQLSNTVKKAIHKSNSLMLYKYLNEKDINLLACFLTSYFEDIISETNIWNAFVNKHQELYGKKLPFFNTDNYYENEVNTQDVVFLIWYFLNTIQQDLFINPYNESIQQLGYDIALVLEEEYEYAPENELLKSFYDLPVTDDYYTVRAFLNRIFTQTYLFFTDTMFNLLEEEVDIIEKNEEDKTLIINYLKENLDEFTFKSTTRLLSLHSKEWTTLILGKEHKLSEQILNLSSRIRGLFLYKGQNHESIYLEHIATSKKFDLKKESFDAHIYLKEIDTIVYLGMVKWGDEWWFSGISFQRPFDADIILDEKSSLESRINVDILDFKNNEQKLKEITEQQKKAFIEYTGGSQIHFLNPTEIDSFLEGYYKYYNMSLNLNNKEHKKAVERAKKEGLLLEKNQGINIKNDENSALIFFNPISGIEIAFGVNSAFPANDNPFYNEVESKQAFLELLISKEYSKELVLYCTENYKQKLSFFKKTTEKLYEKDFDFLLRFFKGANYHSNYNIILTGKE